MQDNSTLWANKMCITELRPMCYPNAFTLRENKFKLLLLIEGGPGGCWEEQKTPSVWPLMCLYLPHLEESGVAAQVAKARQQQMFHCVFAQHGDDFTHDLSRKTHRHWREGKKTSHGFQELDRRKCHLGTMWRLYDWVSANQTVSYRNIFPIYRKHLTWFSKSFEILSKNKKPKCWNTSKLISSWCNE